MSAPPMLHLDARQRAMLDEMGVKVWWPTSSMAAAGTTESDAAAGTEPAAMVVSPQAPAQLSTQEPAPPHTLADGVTASPARAKPAPPAVAAPMPAPRPAAAGGAHGAGVLVDTPRRVYVGDSGGDGDCAPVDGGWLVVVDMPPEADGRHGEVFAGEAGQLLDAMLRALRLHAGSTPVHLMRTHRGVASGQPGGPRSMPDAWVAHATALAPRVVLAMGPLAAQSLLESAEPLGRLRGRVAPLPAIGGTPMVATYHPAYLLRNPADKARAWADLCLAAEQIDPLTR
ncbi:MAG: uracil-DNA glycosylase [Variovorax sp.]|nr:MAG: uracil-DNA glycosylase [Variovorax sp.]